MSSSCQSMLVIRQMLQLDRYLLPSSCKCPDSGNRGGDITFRPALRRYKCMRRIRALFYFPRRVAASAFCFLLFEIAFCSSGAA